MQPVAMQPVFTEWDTEMRFVLASLFKGPVPPVFGTGAGLGGVIVMADEHPFIRVRGWLRQLCLLCLLAVFSLAVVFSYRGACACLRAVRFLEVCVIDHALNPASLPKSPVLVLNFRLKYGLHHRGHLAHRAPSLNYRFIRKTLGNSLCTKCRVMLTGGGVTGAW